jgi:hypothetical protein
VDRTDGGPSQRSGLRRALWAAVLLAAALQPLAFLGAFAGVTQIHLVFAENFALGRFFEFNPGEVVSGETSPGYMLLGALLFRLLPTSAIPVALKLVNLAGWYALSGLIYLVARRCLNDRCGTQERSWPAVAALAAALIPGSSYNANVGMENGLFAALIWLWIDLAAAQNWFEGLQIGEESSGSSIGHELALGVLLGLACWIRPEGFVVLAFAATFKCWKTRRLSGPWVAGLVAAAMIGISSVAFQCAMTGDLVATSVLSRRVLTMKRSLMLGPLSFDPTFVERLAVYLPLSASFIVGVRTRARTPSGLEIFLFGLFILFFGVYSCLTGAAQLARYTIFLMPILAIGAAAGARFLWMSGHRHSRHLVVAAALIFCATDIGESWYRRGRFSQDLLSDAMAAPAHRRERTNALLQSLGDPAKRPVVLAVEAVQLRYTLDGRITVRSFDGRVDRTLLGFVHDGAVDHVGYLQARGVDYFFAPPDYNRDSRQWSLSALLVLGNGETLEHDGLLFRRLPSGAFSVEK